MRRLVVNGFPSDLKPSAKRNKKFRVVFIYSIEAQELVAPEYLTTSSVCVKYFCLWNWAWWVSWRQVGTYSRELWTELRSAWIVDNSLRQFTQYLEEEKRIIMRLVCSSTWGQIYCILADGMGTLTTPPTNPIQICSNSRGRISIFSAWISLRRSAVRQGWIK